VNNITRNFILCLALGSAAAITAPSALAQEPARLGTHDAALESLRAGAVDTSSVALASPEREGLVAASAPILESLRAADMDFSDHEVTVILVTVAVVLLLVVVL